MTPEESSRLIDAAGGNKAFAIALGVDITTDKHYASRISQWRKRGIPPRVQLEHRRKLADLKNSAAQRGVL